MGKDKISVNAIASSDCDEHLLQYRSSGDGDELDVVVGLDFGTSASKVVFQIHDAFGNPVFAVDFGVFAHPSLRYLVPTRLWVAPSGACDLRQQDGMQFYNDLKLELFSHDSELRGGRGPTRQGLAPEVAASAYLALVLRYARKWFLETKRDLLRDRSRIVWSLNLGVPSVYASANEENQRFERVGKAAWMLSTMEGPVTIGNAQDELRLIREAGEYWDRDDDDDGLICDFALKPEISAASHAYARSLNRREGLHLIVDVGASTVDVCGFGLQTGRGEDDRYDLLAARVEQLGTIRLHEERVRAIRDAHVRQSDQLRDAHDPVLPLADGVDPYLISREATGSALTEADDEIRHKVRILLRSIVRDLKRRRDPHAFAWSASSTLPVLLAGGGLQLSFFRSAVDELDEWCKRHMGSGGTHARSVDLSPRLEGASAEHHRLAVACGLSDRAEEIGTVVPPEEIEDIAPPGRSRWQDGFVDKDQT